MYLRKKIRDIIFTDELSQSVLLEYYVTQKQTENGISQLFFGIEIAKYMLENDIKKLEEYEHSGFFSQEETYVTGMAIMLADNSVTPITLDYVLDDIILN